MIRGHKLSSNRGFLLEREQGLAALLGPAIVARMIGHGPGSGSAVGWFVLDNRKAGKQVNVAQLLLEWV